MNSALLAAVPVRALPRETPLLCVLCCRSGSGGLAVLPAGGRVPVSTVLPLPDFPARLLPCSGTPSGLRLGRLRAVLPARVALSVLHARPCRSDRRSRPELLCLRLGIPFALVHASSRPRFVAMSVPVAPRLCPLVLACGRPPWGRRAPRNRSAQGILTFRSARSPRVRPIVPPRRPSRAPVEVVLRAGRPILVTAMVRARHSVARRERSRYPERRKMPRGSFLLLSGGAPAGFLTEEIARMRSEGSAHRAPLPRGSCSSRAFRFHLFTARMCTAC